MAVDRQPRYVTLHQTGANGGGGSLILDTWYSWHPVKFTVRAGMTIGVAADYWCERWNREHDDWETAA